MEYELFNQYIVAHRNSIIIIGVLILIFAIIGVLVVELYVRRELGCMFFKVKNCKISPTLLMIVPIIMIFIYFPLEIYKCNYDIQNCSYEEYIGEVEYSSSSVKFNNPKWSVFVGKGHEIVPAGKHYGKVVYSTKAKVIVSYEEINKITK